MSGPVLKFPFRCHLLPYLYELRYMQELFTLQYVIKTTLQSFPLIPMSQCHGSCYQLLQDHQCNSGHLSFITHAENKQTQHHMTQVISTHHFCLFLPLMKKVCHFCFKIFHFFLSGVEQWLVTKLRQLQRRKGEKKTFAKLTQ